MILGLLTTLISGFGFLNPTPFPPPKGGGLIVAEGAAPPPPTLKLAAVKVKTGIPVYSDSSIKTSPVKVLSGNVSVNKELPEGFYGEWKVASETIETNNPEHWGEIGLDHWILDRIGKTVTLSNPKTGATASITVTEVVGNRATFTRQKFSTNKTTTETVTVTIDGDKFSGTDTQIVKYLIGNEIYKTDVVKYRVVGQKIYGRGF